MPPNGLKHTSQTGSEVRRPWFHVRLSYVFAFNLLLFLACLVGVTSYLFISLRSRITVNMENLVLDSMHRYEDFLVEQFSNVEAVSQQLSYRLASSTHRLRIHQLAESATLTFSQSEVFSVLSDAMYQIPFAFYAYENAITTGGNGYVTLDDDGTSWTEQGCGRSLCYRALSNSSYYQTNFIRPLYGPLPPQNMPPYEIAFDDAVVVSATYVEFLHSLNESNITAGGSWSLPSVWVDAAVPGVWNSSRTIILSYVQCLSVNATTAQCDDAVSIDIKLRDLLEQLFENSGERKGEKFALFHTASMRLLSSTMATVNANATATNCTSLGGCSYPLTALYFATNTPFLAVNYVLSDLLSSCGATPTVRNLQSGRETLSLETYSIPESCSASVKIFDRSLVAGVHRIRASTELDFILLTLNDVAELEGSVMDTLESSVSAVVVVSVVVTATIAYVFVAVTQGVKHLTSRFNQAENMNFEGAMANASVPASSSSSSSTPLRSSGDSNSNNIKGGDGCIGSAFLKVPLAEVARLESAFARLSATLLKTRAFLPQQLLQSGRFTTTKHLPSRRHPRAPTTAVGTTAGVVPAEDSAAFDFALFSPEEQSADPPQALAAVVPGENHATVPDSMITVSSSSTTTTTGTRVVPTLVQRHAAVPLSTARVTVVWVNLGSFHGKFRQMRPPAAQQEHAVVIQSILDSVRTCGGVVDFFHGDHFMMSFNASTVCRQHELLGTEAAVQIIRAQRYVRVGLSTGTAFCGVFGCSSLRRFCIVGPVVNHAFALMRHSKVEQLTNLMSQATFDCIHTEYIAEHRGRVWMKTVEKNVLKDTMISTIRKRREYSLAPTSGITTSGASSPGFLSPNSESSNIAAAAAAAAAALPAAVETASAEVQAIARRERQYDVINKAFVLAECGDVAGSRRVIAESGDIPEQMTQRLAARWAAIESSQPLPVCV